MDDADSGPARTPMGPARAPMGKGVRVAIGLIVLVLLVLLVSGPVLRPPSGEKEAAFPDAVRAGTPPPAGPSSAGRTVPVAVPEQGAAGRTVPLAAPEPGDAGRLDREAMNAWRTGDIHGAMSLFEQAVAAAPDDPAPHSHYGRLLTLMVAYERAIPLLERARDLVPRDAQAWLDLATAYERAQRFDDAWAARAAAEKLVGAGAVTRDERGRFVVVGNEL